MAESSSGEWRSGGRSPSVRVGFALSESTTFFTTQPTTLFSTTPITFTGPLPPPTPLDPASCNLLTSTSTTSTTSTGTHNSDEDFLAVMVGCDSGRQATHHDRAETDHDLHDTTSHTQRRPPKQSHLSLPLPHHRALHATLRFLLGGSGAPTGKGGGRQEAEAGA